MFKICKFAAYVCLIFKVSLCLSQENPEVTTKLGKIRGHYKLSYEQKKFSAFEGIPYAKPPIGDKRFKEPESIENWNGIWQANQLYECAQFFPAFNINVVGDEDCLYLDVYVPSEKINLSANYNVIVHIHGGGLLFGSGHLYSFPEYLMDHEVIFVNFNYRLGVFGFLSTEDDVVPGNNGFKDQVLALRWVKNNIASFGGNPNSITLTGASAGAASVHLHYFSSLSRNLFHRGFSQSGCALNSWLIQKDALEKTKNLALEVGCPTNSSRVLVDCLKQRNYRQVLEATRVLYPYTSGPFLPFGAVVEKNANGFLTKAPKELLEEKNLQDLPWLASFVEEESVGLFGEFINKSEDFNKFFNKCAPFMLNYKHLVPEGELENLRDTIREFYLDINKKASQNQNISEIFQILSDRMFVTGIARSAKLQAKSTKSEVFLFKFGYTGDSKNLAAHADDNQYFYYDSKGKKPTENELKMRDVMIKMLLEYAKTDKPYIEEIDWKPVTDNELQFLEISGFKTENIQLKLNNNLGNLEFWSSLEFLKNE